jgi:hypothetical protein
MSLARVLIRHMQSDDDAGGDEEEWDEDGDLSDISACENLLESYFAQASRGFFLAACSGPASVGFCVARLHASSPLACHPTAAAGC